MTSFEAIKGMKKSEEKDILYVGARFPLKRIDEDRFEMASPYKWSLSFTLNDIERLCDKGLVSLGA